MNGSDRFAHIYRSGDTEFTIPVVRLKDSFETEATPIYRNPSGSIEELSRHIEMAFAASGSVVAVAVNPWQTPEGDALRHADFFCEVSWRSTGVYLSPYQLLIDEEENERGWVEDATSVIELGESPSFHQIALAVSEFFEKGGNSGRPALADQAPVTRPADTATGDTRDMG